MIRKEKKRGKARARERESERVEERGIKKDKWIEKETEKDKILTTDKDCSDTIE